jgi:hypothetical protein
MPAVHGGKEFYNRLLLKILRRKVIMKEKIAKIHELLNEIEKEEPLEDIQFVKNFDALEIPSIICSVVDYLFPILSPIETTIYIYLFRHSILANGQQHLRVSVTTLINAASSHHKEKSNISSKSVQKALKGLEEIGALTIDGEVTHDGTLYKVKLPDEIPTCQERIKAINIKITGPIQEKRELDFYNVTENRLKVFERDAYKCHYCKKQLTRFSATLDHIQPVSKGGLNSFDNLTTSCLHCNSERGNRPLMDFIIDKSTKS